MNLNYSEVNKFNVLLTILYTIFFITICFYINYNVNKITYDYVYLGEFINVKTNVIVINDDYQLTEYDHIVTYKDENGNIQKYDGKYDIIVDNGKKCAYKNMANANECFYGFLLAALLIFLIYYVIDDAIMREHFCNPFKMYAIGIKFLIMTPIEYCKDQRKQ